MYKNIPRSLQCQKGRGPRDFEKYCIIKKSRTQVISCDWSMMDKNGNHIPYKIITLNIARKGARQHIVKTVDDGLKAGLNTFKIRLSAPNPPTYPNTCVPVAGILDHYRQKYGCTFIPAGNVRASTYLYKTRFLMPKSYSDEDRYRTDFLDCVWRFSSQDEYELVSGIVHSIRSKIRLESGVIESIELCLHEIMDNVLNHSLPSEANDEPIGYVMAQCHQENETVAVAVYDNGQGILKSFEGSNYHPETAEEAIQLALTKNVTNGNGAGRGMWMLASIVAASKGLIEISSDRAKYHLQHDEQSTGTPTYSKIGSEINGTTSVDFRLRTNTAIDIADALEGHTPVDLWLEGHEADADTILFDIERESHGTGTRHAARALRTIVVNASRQRGQRVVLDFANTSIVSSSYADELIGKAIDELGFTRFAERFSLRNVSETNALIIDEALFSHIAQTEKARQVLS